MLEFDETEEDEDEDEETIECPKRQELDRLIYLAQIQESGMIAGWERWGAEKENAWIGHSEAIRKKHYKGQFSDEAFAEAAGVDQKTHVKTHAKGS